MSGDAMRKHAAKLRGDAETLVPRASEAVRKVTIDTQADSMRNVVAMDAVDTGNMLNSHQVAFANGGLRGAVVVTASYSVFVHDGTSRMPPRPFLGRATDRNKPLFYKAMAQLGGDG